MLRHFFFRVHSRVSRAQSDFKFVSASRRRNAAPSREAGLSNQHASGVRSPEGAADTAAATTKRLGRARRLQFTSSRKSRSPSPQTPSTLPALTRIPPGLLALAGLPVYLASSHAARFLRSYVFA